MKRTTNIRAGRSSKGTAPAHTTTGTAPTSQPAVRLPLAAVIRSLPRWLTSRAAHRTRWGIIDQGFSSLTNFAITALAAREASPADFGSFSVSLSIYIFLLWGARSSVGEPYLIRMTNAPIDIQRAGAAEAVGASFGIGAFSGAAMVLVGLLLRSSLGWVLVAMGTGMPGLLAQDSYRYVLMAMGRTRAAATNDGLWLVLQSAAVVALLLGGIANAISLTIAFGSAATAAALVGHYQCGVKPSPSTGPRWIRKHKDLGLPILLELVTVNGVPQLSLLCVAGLGGVIVVGKLRAAMFLLSPPTVLFSGLVLIGLPEAVRLRGRSLSGLRWLVVGLAVTMSCLTVGWALVLWLIPARVGMDLLKSNWANGRRLLVPITALTAANACTYGAIVGLRALEVARESLRFRIWAGPVILASSVIGAAVAGAWGTAIGMALSSWFSALLAWIVFRRAFVREKNARGTAENPS